MRIGRLAASQAHRGQRLGELLLANAIKRTLAARHTLGVYAVLVEAKDAAAEAFYRKYGFRPLRRTRPASSTCRSVAASNGAMHVVAKSHRTFAQPLRCAVLLR